MISKFLNREPPGEFKSRKWKPEEMEAGKGHLEPFSPSLHRKLVQVQKALRCHSHLITSTGVDTEPLCNAHIIPILLMGKLRLRQGG